MRRFALLCTLLYSSVVYAQQFVPHPYAFAGPEAMGGGYSSFAAIAGGGFRIDSKHFLLDTNAWYDTGRKTNDNDQPNPSGHDRGLSATVDYRLSSGWFFGGGARWSELSTSNYRKSSWRPVFGGGKDYFHQRCAGEHCFENFSMRLGADYVLAGTDWANGSQGPRISFYVPSPASKHHIFYRESVGIYRFHTTVTDRSNLELTREQMGQHSISSVVEFTMMYRF